MSFSSTVKSRLPWFDTTRLEMTEASVQGTQLENGIANLVITLFEELAEQSRVRALEERETCAKCDLTRKLCECKEPLFLGAKHEP